MKHPSLLDTTLLVHDKMNGFADKQGDLIAAHCVRVSYLAHKFGCKDLHAALMHDLIEDTPMTIYNLAVLGYSTETIDRVRLLTHELPEPYWVYIRRIGDSGDRDTILIKIADQMDNLDPKRRAQLEPEFLARLDEKYQGVLPYLQACLGGRDR